MDFCAEYLTETVKGLFLKQPIAELYMAMISKQDCVLDDIRMCNFGKSVCTLVLCLHHVIASFLFCISTSASPNTHLETSSPPLAPPRVLQPTCVTELERAATSSLLTHHIALSRSKEFKTSKTITRLFWALLGRRGWVGHQKQGSCGSRTGNDVLLRNSLPPPPPPVFTVLSASGYILQFDFKALSSWHFKC